MTFHERGFSEGYSKDMGYIRRTLERREKKPTLFALDEDLGKITSLVEL